MKKSLFCFVMLVVAMSAAAVQLDRGLGQQMPAAIRQIHEATPEVEQAILHSGKARAPRNLKSPATKASDLVGGYSCAYNWTDDIATSPDAIATLVSGTKSVRIYDANDSQKSIMIAGLFDAPVRATVDFTSYDVPLIVFDANPIATYDQYNGGGYYNRGVGYYAAQDRFFFTQIRAWVYDNEIELVDNIWIVSVATISGGTNTLWGYVWKPGSLMTPNDQVNGVMTYHYDDFDFGSALHISQNTSYVVTVDNFADVAVNPVIIRLKAGNKWVADQVTLYSGEYGDYILKGTNDDKEFFQLAGTGNSFSLTSSSDWTAVVDNGEFWFGQCEPFTIRWFDDQFVFPGQTQLKPGDIDGNGTVDVNDINMLINLMLGKASAADCVGNPDLNGDSITDVTDVNSIVNIMLGKEN